MIPADKPRLRAVIACAMPEEIAPFLNHVDRAEPLFSTERDGKVIQAFYVASFEGQTVLLAQTGIGLVNAASAAARALEWFQTDLYLLAGTTGGLAEQVEVGDVIAGTRTLYHDADAVAFGYEPGQIPQMPAEYATEEGDFFLPAAHSGLVLSGNSFVTADNVDVIRERYPLGLAVDMETAAAAQVCYTQDVPWVSLRAVSDLCGPRADQDFHMEAERAADISFQAVRQLFQSFTTE